MFLDTHTADVAKPHLGEMEDRDGLRGRAYPEFGWTDPLSGIDPQAFWLTRESLLALVASCGLDHVATLADESDHNDRGPRVGLLLHRRPPPG
jgi:hypothetical protein